VPIIQCVGQSPSGQLLLLDMDQTTAELSKAMSPLKVMFVNGTGGITNDLGDIVANINLPHDLHAITDQSWYTPAVQNKVSFFFTLSFPAPECIFYR
jgi:acetylglutamate kinase